MPAEAFIQRGIALRRDHKDADALVAFQHAYAIDRTPRALAQVALAEAALEQWVGAEGDLARALASDDAWVERQRAALRLALQEIEGHLGTLQVSGPEGADISIDGAAYGAVGPFMRVPAKHLALEVHASGFEPDRRELDVAPNEVVRVSVNLERTRAKDNPAPASPPRAAIVVPAAKDVPAGAWVATGIAAFFTVTGGVFAAYASDRAAHYNNNDECADILGSPRSTRCAGYASQFQVAQTAEVVSFTLAGASAVSAAVLFLLRPHGETGPARVGLVPTLGGAALLSTF